MAVAWHRRLYQAVSLSCLLLADCLLLKPNQAQVNEFEEQPAGPVDQANLGRVERARHHKQRRHGNGRLSDKEADDERHGKIQMRAMVAPTVVPSELPPAPAPSSTDQPANALQAIASQRETSSSANSPKTAPETKTPNFHFSSSESSLVIEPSSLSYYDGVYHLFIDKEVNKSGAKNASDHDATVRWGHAVSTNLVEWEQLDDISLVDNKSFIHGGSVVVDWQNRTGFQTDEEQLAMVAIFTTGTPCVQRLTFSSDGGKTWKKYPHMCTIKGMEKDAKAWEPKVQWHEESRRFIMVAETMPGVVGLYSSRNLLDWGLMQKIDFGIQSSGVRAKPSFFRLSISEEDRRDERWVLWRSGGNYVVGKFDGRTFISNHQPIQNAEYGDGYGSVTFYDEDRGRVIQMSALPGRYHGGPRGSHLMAQLSFPVELDLVRGMQGNNSVLQVRRVPVPEITLLRGKKLFDSTLHAQGDNSTIFIQDSRQNGASGAFEARFRAKLPTDTSSMSVTTPCQDLTLTGDGEVQTDYGRHMPLKVVEDRFVDMWVLCDHFSLEVYDAAGGASMLLSKMLPTNTTKEANVIAQRRRHWGEVPPGVNVMDFFAYELEGSSRALGLSLNLPRATVPV